MVEAILEAFNPIIITSQREYEKKKHSVHYIVSMEPGWAAPKMSYDTSLRQLICVFASDPHNKVHWFADYILENKIAYVLSQYYHPFLYHFPNFPQNKVVHFPWAVPDKLLSRKPLSCRNNDVVLFGAKNGDAYDVRNWCRQQDGINSYDASGVENKSMTAEQYSHWLNQFDAVVAAGSSDAKYELVTPKYFEICAAGCLLIGQGCKDLERLGFNEHNMLIFTPDKFSQIISHYKGNPNDYLGTRINGWRLIKERHLISHRIQLLRALFSNYNSYEVSDLLAKN
jgi:hypothetical protein